MAETSIWIFSSELEDSDLAKANAGDINERRRSRKRLAMARDDKRCRRMCCADDRRHRDRNNHILQLRRFNHYIRRGYLGRDEDEQEASQRKYRCQDGELPRHADDSTQGRAAFQSLKCRSLESARHGGPLGMTSVLTNG